MNIPPLGNSQISCFNCTLKKRDFPTLTKEQFISLKNITHLVPETVSLVENIMLPEPKPIPQWDESFLTCLPLSLKNALIKADNSAPVTATLVAVDPNAETEDEGD